MTIEQTDVTLMCRADLADLIEFQFDQLAKAITRNEKKAIHAELKAAVDHYNSHYGKTFIQP